MDAELFSRRETEQDAAQRREQTERSVAVEAVMGGTLVDTVETTLSAEKTEDDGETRIAVDEQETQQQHVVVDPGLRYRERAAAAARSAWTEALGTTEIVSQHAGADPADAYTAVAAPRQETAPSRLADDAPERPFRTGPIPAAPTPTPDLVLDYQSTAPQAEDLPDRSAVAADPTPRQAVAAVNRVSASAGTVPAVVGRPAEEATVYGAARGGTADTVLETVFATTDLAGAIETQVYTASDEFTAADGTHYGAGDTVSARYVDIDGMDMDRTEYFVNGELATESIDSIDLGDGDTLTFVEADVFADGGGHGGAAPALEEMLPAATATRQIRVGSDYDAVPTYTATR